jgi:hypothetical protein
MIVYPVEKASQMLAFYRKFNESAPDELTTFAGLLTTPDGARVAVAILGYNGPPEEGEKGVWLF